MTCEYTEREDVITEYVEGTLTGDAREAFEAHFFGCDRCFAQLQMTEKLIGTMQEHGDEVFASFRDRARTATTPAPRRHTKTKRFNMMGAMQKMWHLRFEIVARVALLALLVVLLGSWFLKYFVFPIDYKQLAAVQPSPWPEEVKTSDGKLNTLVEQAREQFNDRQYGGASNTLSEAVGIDPTMASLQYLLGASCYLAGDNDNAIVHLTEAVKMAPDLDDARWYLAHAHLKKHERKNAIDQFVILVGKEGSGYSKRSREILKDIDPLFFLGRGF